MKSLPVIESRCPDNRCALRERADASPWSGTFDQLIHSSRMLAKCKGTENEAHWREEVIRWALGCAQTETTKEQATLQMMKTVVQNRLSEHEAADGVFVERGGGHKEWPADRVRLAVFSERDYGSHDMFGCRDLTRREAYEVGCELVGESGIRDEEPAR